MGRRSREKKERKKKVRRVTRILLNKELRSFISPEVLVNIEFHNASIVNITNVISWLCELSVPYDFWKASIKPIWQHIWFEYRESLPKCLIDEAGDKLTGIWLATGSKDQFAEHVCRFPVVKELFEPSLGCDRTDNILCATNYSTNVSPTGVFNSLFRLGSSVVAIDSIGRPILETERNNLDQESIDTLIYGAGDDEMDRLGNLIGDTADSMPEGVNTARDAISVTLSQAFDDIRVALSLMRCEKQVEVVREPTHYYRKSADATDGEDTGDIYRIISFPKIKRIFKDGGFEGGEHGEARKNRGKTRAHVVIPHPKTYGPEAPLMGKHVGTFFWKQHMRGDPDKGRVHKEYKVNPPKELQRT